MNVQVVSDQKLLNCYLSGDRNAISQLIERHSRRVRDYIQMMVKDGDVADDIFQETFIKAVRVIDEGRYTDNGRFLSWILRIAHNQVIDHFRACKQNKQVNESESGYNVLGSLRFAEKTIETEPAAQRGRSRLRRIGYVAAGGTHRRRRNRLRADRQRCPPHGGVAARRTARGGDDALLFGPKFQGDRRTDRCQHQHGAGAYAVRADQPSENDQGKKPDFKLEEAQ